MLRTKVTSGDIFGEIKISVKAFEQKMRSKVNAIAPATAEKMKEIIQSNKKRPQAGEPTVLEDNIDYEMMTAEAGWGVGNISTLDQNAKHWRAVNYGSKHLVGKHLPPGIFEPGNPAPDKGSFRAGRFKVGGLKDDKSYSPIIKKEIPAMNYITKTVNFVRRQFNALRIGK